MGSRDAVMASRDPVSTMLAIALEHRFRL